MTFTRVRRWGQVAAIVGAAGIGLGLVQAPDRTWAGILIASFGLVAAGVGGLFFVALQYASGATWSAAFRRVPEAFSSVIPIGAAGLAAVFMVRSSMYPWMAEAGDMAGFKGAWLNPAFFFVRAAVYVGLWVLFATLIVRTSRAQDRSTTPQQMTARSIKLSLGFIIIFALSFWLASVDWIMSLDPHWYSTIFGVYHFAGMFSSTLALLILALLWLRRSGLLADFIRDEHVHDLGKLLLAFCTFWMYIWFSQYMLIWYANIPEESVYYVNRRTGLWLPLFYANPAINWVIPFLMLLSKPAKRGPIVAYAAVIVLVGRWLDLYFMVWPSVVPGASPAVGVPEIAPAVLAAGLFVLTVARAFDAAPPVPLREPAMATSLHYHS